MTAALHDAWYNRAFLPLRCLWQPEESEATVDARSEPRRGQGWAVCALERTGELMDDPACPRAELEHAFRDLALMNRLLGAWRFVVAYLDRVLPTWLAGRRSSAPLLVLDVATGAGDVPALVVRWASQRSVPVRVLALDRHPVGVQLARALTGRTGAVQVVRADARALPLAPASVDVALCNLALHHLTPQEAQELLRDLSAVSRLGFLVTDLLRSPTGYAAVWAVTRLSRSPLIRHDGPLSVRRSLRWDQYCELAAASGVPSLRVRRLPLFRVALERVP